MIVLILLLVCCSLIFITFRGKYPKHLIIYVAQMEEPLKSLVHTSNDGNLTRNSRITKKLENDSWFISVMTIYH